MPTSMRIHQFATQEYYFELPYGCFGSVQALMFSCSNPMKTGNISISIFSFTRQPDSMTKISVATKIFVQIWMYDV